MLIIKGDHMHLHEDIFLEKQRNFHLRGIYSVKTEHKWCVKFQAVTIIGNEAVYTGSVHVVLQSFIFRIGFKMSYLEKPYVCYNLNAITFTIVKWRAAWMLPL